MITKKRQFVLESEDAGRLATTCTSFMMCTSCTLMRIDMRNLLVFIGPLQVDLECARRVLALESEWLENRFDLAVQFGEWYSAMVAKIRTHWLIDDIITLFQRLWVQEKGELCVL
jgi:hypothetical protein